jgi:hypothetical protein
VCASCECPITKRVADIGEEANVHCCDEDSLCIKRVSLNDPTLVMLTAAYDHGYDIQFVIFLR